MTLSKQQIAHQFSRAASTYDDASPLQREMAEKLIGNIPTETQGTLVDMGCGTGWALERIASHDRFKLIGIDFAPAMIETAKVRVPSAQFHCCDLETTPLPDNSVDIVLSNAAIQWCDSGSAIAEMFRVCKPGGLLRLSTFGPGTLTEIQSAWEDSGDTTSRVQSFETVQTMTSLAETVGFRSVVCNSEIQIQRFDCVDDLLASIKRLGATNASNTRSTGLLGIRRYRKFRHVLDSRLKENGHLELTYNCFFVFGEK